MSEDATDKIAAQVESHFSAMALGLLALSHGLPANVMWEAIAKAMGNVLSAASKSGDVKSTIETRGRLGDLVNKAIRHRYPAISPVPATELDKERQAS